MTVMLIEKNSLEGMRQLHNERGGRYTWGQISAMFGLGLPEDALRKRVGRYETALYGVVRPSVGIVNDIRNAQGLRSSADCLEDVLARILPDESRDSSFYADDDNLPQQPVRTGQNLDGSDNAIDVDSAVDSEPNDRLRFVEQQNAALLALMRQVLASVGNANVSQTDLAQLGIVITRDEGMYHADELPNDSALWDQYNEQMWAAGRLNNCLVLSDIHFPDHSAEALTMAYQLAAMIQPNVIVMAGDNFDFDGLGSFGQPRQRVRKNPFKESRAWWNMHIDYLKQASPDSVLVAFNGNHEARLFRHNSTTGSPFADTTEEEYVNMVRADGRVWYIPEQEVTWGNLLIKHGTTVTDATPKNNVLNAGTTVVQGHIHRAMMHWRRVSHVKEKVSNGVGRSTYNYHINTGIVNGCLCNIPPHYQIDKMESSWVNGVSLITMMAGTLYNNVQPIVFHPTGNGNNLWTMFGNHYIST